MGKQDYKWSDNVRFGDLTSEERKAVTRVVGRGGSGGSFDHTSICTGEIGALLTCLESNAWAAKPCLEPLRAMHACVDAHKHDPDPRVLARRWQSTLRANVFQYFAKQKVLGRFR